MNNPTLYPHTLPIKLKPYPTCPLQFIKTLSTANVQCVQILHGCLHRHHESEPVALEECIRLDRYIVEFTEGK